MKKNIILSSLILGASLVGNAQSSKDRAVIKKMCGCFEVTFNFAETFEYSDDSLYKPSRTKHETALEWAGLVVDEKNEIAIQHILQVGNPAEPHIVKHWRQDWMYQNTNFYMFSHDNKWNFERKTKQEVKGQWTQKVYQVDDSPRYEGSGSWVHVDGKSYWESTTDAPLPRREYTKRSDYNLTIRGNRQEITSTGWVHDQDNKKIIRKEGAKDVLLAEEKGYNTYVKVDDSKCKAAAEWWKNNSGKWKLVRTKWDEVYGRNTNLALESKVDNKPLYKHLYGEDYDKQENINKIIDSFVK